MLARPLSPLFGQGYHAATLRLPCRLRVEWRKVCCFVVPVAVYYYVLCVRHSCQPDVCEGVAFGVCVCCFVVPVAVYYDVCIMMCVL